ncbi:MAG: histidine kinase [Bacteroidales bacterium]
MITPARKRTLSLLTNPFFLAAIPSIALFFIIPVMHQRYRLDLLSSTQVYEGYYHSYCDLDSDGNSEKIVAFDEENASGITISRDNRVLNQWNVSGSFNFSNRNTLFIPADCNADGVKEVYLFSLSGDSVLLHCIPEPEAVTFSTVNKLTDSVGPGIKSPDPFIVAADPEDLDGDGFPELIFGITTGFSKHPRKVYAYNTVTDSIISSPQCGGFMLGIVQYDLNHDGFREIIPFGYASENIGKGEMKLHDHSTWLTVLDRNLQFVFDPVEFAGRFTMAQPMIHPAATDTVADVLVSRGEPDSSAVFRSFGMNGLLPGRTPLQSSAVNGLVTVNRKGEPVYALIENERGIVILDDKKQLSRVIEFKGTLQIKTLDIDPGGTEEILAVSLGEGTVTVYRSGFIRPAMADLGPELRGEPQVSVIYRKGEWPKLFLQSDTRQLILEYRPNPLYLASFVYYPLLYAAFIAFVLLIQFSQKRVLARREDEKKKITELQMALLRNQLDPHFTLNALNSVLSMVELSEKEKARESLLRFSGLYREILLSAGKSTRSLAEELEFCREYLALEQLRYMNRFAFIVSMQPGINDELPVPKLVIQLFAENSVKHGLAGLEGGGMLEINLKGTDNILTIEVKDNGVGRALAVNDHNSSTGKGMKLMSDLFDLCNSHFDESYCYTVSDLSDGNGNPAGTLVTITISYRYESVFIS